MASRRWIFSILYYFMPFYSDNIMTVYFQKNSYRFFEVVINAFGIILNLK